jgi:hypothetical protein
MPLLTGGYLAEYVIAANDARLTREETP